MSESQLKLPNGELVIRTLAMPADANPSGDIFGGWVLSQMYVSCDVVSYHHVTRVRVSAG